MKQYVRVAFHGLCLTATAFMTVYCIYQYYLNEDVCLVDFQKFNEKETNLYPSVSMCIYNPFIEAQLAKYNTNTIEYSNFLKGHIWKQQLFNIDYDSVTLDLNKYLLGYVVMWKNGTIADVKGNLHDQKNNGGWGLPYTIYRNSLTKCFAVDIPFERGAHLIRLAIRVRHDIFPNSIRPPTACYDFTQPNCSGFQVAFHYPQNFLRSLPTMKYTWPPHHNDSADIVDMQFTINSMEVLLSRNKKGSGCNNVWTRQDEGVLSKVIATVGCKPPYWKDASTFAVCLTQEKMDEIDTAFQMEMWGKALEEYDPPCQRIEKLLWEYEEISYKHDSIVDSSFYPKENVSYYALSMQFFDISYKQIEQIRAYDFQSLIGNAGGYIGLFLGYAILQLPELIAMTCRRIFPQTISNQDEELPESRYIHTRETDKKISKIYDEIVALRKMVNVIQEEMDVLKQNNRYELR